MLNSHLLLLLILAFSVASASAGPIVEMEILTEANVAATDAHEWLHVLQKLSVKQIRIRGRQPGDAGPKVTRMNKDKVRVVALLTSDGRLHVPSAQFSMRDGAKLKEWIEKVASGENRDDKKTHIPVERLAALRKRLAIPVGESTTGMRLDGLVKRAKQATTVSVQFDRSMQARRSKLVVDELKGISFGTALAIAARASGGSVEVNPDGRTLTIVGSARTERAWPIGWQPDRRSPDLVPKFGEFLNVELNDVALSDFVTAIEKKVGIPFLVDHHQLSTAQIDIKKMKVNVRPRRALYRRVIDGVLARCLLHGELRVDDAGQPFYWITKLERRRS